MDNVYSTMPFAISHIATTSASQGYIIHLQKSHDHFNEQSELVAAPHHPNSPGHQLLEFHIQEHDRAIWCEISMFPQ
jgi:hypothetical protein